MCCSASVLALPSRFCFCSFLLNSPLYGRHRDTISPQCTEVAHWLNFTCWGKASEKHLRSTFYNWISNRSKSDQGCSLLNVYDTWGPCGIGDRSVRIVDIDIRRWEHFATKIKQSCIGWILEQRIFEQEKNNKCMMIIWGVEESGTGVFDGLIFEVGTFCARSISGCSSQVAFPVYSVLVYSNLLLQKYPQTIIPSAEIVYRAICAACESRQSAWMDSGVPTNTQPQTRCQTLL